MVVDTVDIIHSSFCSNIVRASLGSVAYCHVSLRCKNEVMRVTAYLVVIPVGTCSDSHLKLSQVSLPGDDSVWIE